jgi:DNA-binding transcriptional LysR family regulator
MDRIQAFRLFIRVVDLGSFSKAAADLGMGQPSATKQVAQMEKQLGARLLHRSTHGVMPTEVGVLYYEKCKLILHHVEEAENAATLLQSEVLGGLRISTSVAFGRLVLASLVMHFMQLNPKLHVELMVEDHIVNLVEQGVDVAIRLGPLADSTLGSRYLGVNPWVTVASANYLKRRGTPADPADLAAHDALIYTTVQGDARWHFSGRDHQAVVVPVKGFLRSNSLLTLLDAAKAGMGIAILPWYVANDPVKESLIQPVLTNWSLPAQQIHAVYPSPNLVPAKVRRFVDWLQRQFGRSWWVNVK